MRSILIILFCLPIIGLGQNIPLAEKKLSPQSEKVKQKNHNKSLAMHPKNQIGYITNFTSHPWGGLNYFNHFSPRMGFYIEWRPSGNVLHGNNFTGTATYEGEYTVFNETLWTSVANVGFSFRISNSQDVAFMIYGGIGSAGTKTYSGYPPLIESGYWWVEDGGRITKTNFNFGILIQTDALVSWQVGFDSAVPGINFGIGLTFD